MCEFFVFRFSVNICAGTLSCNCFNDFYHVFFFACFLRLFRFNFFVIFVLFSFSLLRARYGEQRGGRDIYPDSNGHYEIINDGKAIVRATAMKHGVPCVGYCIEEPTKPGR